VELDFGDRRNDSSFPRFSSPDSSTHDSNPLHNPTTRQTHRIARIPSNSAVNTPRVTIPMDTSPSHLDRPCNTSLNRPSINFRAQPPSPAPRETGPLRPQHLGSLGPTTIPTHRRPPQGRDRVLASNRSPTDRLCRVVRKKSVCSKAKKQETTHAAAQQQTESRQDAVLSGPAAPSADRHRKKR
jgi:hypothetical protein